MRLALSLAVLGALTSPAFADAELARVDTDGFLVFFIAVVLGLLSLPFVVRESKRSERKMRERFAARHGIPVARVVSRRT